MVFLNKNEGKIIKYFLEKEERYINKSIFLHWRDKGSVVGRYEVLIEDENDYEIEEEKYEEFWSFGFNLIHLEGNPPISINHQNNFLINYHNFPDEIIVDGQKIN